MFDDKLVLKEKMGSSYLIQRLTKPMNWKARGKEVALNSLGESLSFGGGLKNGGLSDKAMGLLRDIFAFDYMGSSEFEWGAVPQALSFLANQSSEGNLVADSFKLDKGETIYFISPKAYQEEVKDRINLLREEKLHLKERCCLKDYFESDREWNKKYVGWLELDNGFMFFVDKDVFQKTCDLLGVKIN